MGMSPLVPGAYISLAPAGMAQHPLSIRGSCARPSVCAALGMK